MPRCCTRENFLFPRSNAADSYNGHPYILVQKFLEKESSLQTSLFSYTRKFALNKMGGGVIYCPRFTGAYKERYVTRRVNELILGPSMHRQGTLFLSSFLLFLRGALRFHHFSIHRSSSFLLTHLHEISQGTGTP